MSYHGCKNEISQQTKMVPFFAVASAGNNTEEHGFSKEAHYKFMLKIP